MMVTKKTILKVATAIVKDLVGHPATKKATVVYLIGELGSGKTTLMQHIGKVLGITQKIQSPTFPIMKVYPLKHSVFDTVVHIDAYRLTGKKETLTDRIKEKGLVSQTLMFVEWPNLLPKGTVVPHATIRISFVKTKSDTRLITYDTTHHPKQKGKST